MVGTQQKRINTVASQGGGGLPYKSDGGNIYGLVPLKV